MGQIFRVDFCYDGGFRLKLRIENAAWFVKRRSFLLHQHPFADLKLTAWMEAKDAFSQAALLQVEFLHIEPRDNAC